MNERGLSRYVVVALTLLTLYAALASAQEVRPEGPDTINVSTSERGEENESGVAVQAQAGNVTGLQIYADTVTRSWQGYYGNVSGSIVLADSDDNLFYDWNIADPSGEVYAVNASDSPEWNSVYCLNVSQNEARDEQNTDVTLPITRPDGSVSSVNSSRIEQEYGINATDKDGLNETFTDFWTGSFVVASVTIDSTDACSSAHPYVNNQSTTDWNEVILSDNDTLIFTSILRENQTNFRGDGADFQMLVLEDGHTQAADVATTYYFYVELS